ncbi:hypothetical protein L1D14_10545 [Vibrio tubiashii]|uniref:hypothetical protein n=1 Tax=Vibrio tubiashii TaxID=29498 RepID=UPI001EFC3E92|nr:hypothetical protein [Vibrio tubiashii]MCG9576676.1 hypothetical protein [Vibrio tubiashii]
MMNQVENQEQLESVWKKEYVQKQVNNGNNPTIYLETSELDISLNKLNDLSCPNQISEWIDNNLSREYQLKLSSSIRTRRHRSNNGTKSVDLSYISWKELSDLSNELGLSLSQTVLKTCQRYRATKKESE